MSNGTSRRGFFKRMAVAAGVIGASRLPGMSLLGRADAAVGTEPPALFVINLVGGYNALFGSAGSFVGSGAFGVTGANTRRIGTSELVVDRRTLGALSDSTLDNMASIGIRHGISSHPRARNALFFTGNDSNLVKLASLMGGDAAVKCVAIGNMVPEGTHRAIDGVSMQQVRDLKTTIEALGGGIDPDAPKRPVAGDGLAAAAAMSGTALMANPSSGRSLAESYPTAIDQLKAPVVPFSYPMLAEAYGVNANNTAVNNIRTQIMGAELMIQAGANVVVASQGGWDSHNDRDGARVRNKMVNDGIVAALKTFTDRTLAMTNRNVVTVIVGDFSRSLPGSDHQPNLTTTVMGKYVRLGTTGRVNAQVALPAATPSYAGFWAYLAAVLGVPGTPFGANPHDLVL